MMMDTVVKLSGDVISDLLKDAIKTQKFADVALCCSGGQRFLTHRLVLSAASPYLHEVLRAHGTIVGQCEVITVILAEVEGNDLEAILAFLYTGSAMIPKSRLEAFSSAADALRIKIPPLPFTLTLPDSPKHHVDRYNYLDYQSKIVEHIDRDYLKPEDVCGNNTVETESKSKIMPTESLRQLLPSPNFCNDNSLNLKSPKISSNKVMGLKSHVANRVIASPWCQLVKPYHSPKIRPITWRSDHSSSAEYHCKEISSASSFTSNVPAFYSSLIHERLARSPNEITVGVANMYSLNSHDLSDQVQLDGPQDMSGSAGKILEVPKNHEDDKCRLNQDVNLIPKFDTLLLNQSHSESQDKQSLKITPTDHDCVAGNKEKLSLNTLETIRWSDSNNNSFTDAKHDDITSTENGEYKCQICKRTFVNRNLLKVHSRCHSGEKPFRCADCGKEFSQLRNYKYHRSVHEGTGEFSGTCPECGKCFNDRGYLGSHMKIHRNRKEYVCQECGKSFNQRVAYNMHVRIHTGVKPHRCDQCGKAFSRKMLLKQHLRTHSGERPYQCHICHKAFADRSNMTLHTRLHSGLKPYQCDICSKAFTKKHHLKTHLNYHTGTKPYSCPNCSVAFSQSSNMRTHYKKCMINKPNGRIIDKIES